MRRPGARGCFRQVRRMATEPLEASRPGQSKPLLALVPVALQRAASRLVERLTDLEQRVVQGDETAWPAYLEAVNTLAILAPQLAAEHRRVFLTTAEMAERLQISPKTLLKRKARGELRPALQRGKLIRWRGDEPIR